jgi:acetoin utilization deacetylase AcuC-like enzyme
MTGCETHIIYSEKEKLHAPDQEWNFGRVVPYPEKENRGETIIDEIKKRGYESMLSQAPEHDMRHLEAVHHDEMIEHIRSCKNLDEDEAVYPHLFSYHHYHQNESEINYRLAGYFCFDVGTIIKKNTFIAAKAAIDVAIEGAHCMLNGKEKQIFALCRPPGHHADYRHYGGYCYFNNAAAAANLLSNEGKVVILDLDYHHGNGTQGIFYHTPTVLYVSLHADPRTNYPYFCGFEAETGEGLGTGYNMNIPLPDYCDNETYYKALDKALERIADYGPRHLIISMGFDTFDKDPLGDFHLTADAFTRIGATLRQANLPTLAVLEGGYDVDDLGENASNFAEGLFDL